MLTFELGLGAQVPVEDPIAALVRGLASERLVRHRVDDLLKVGPVTGLDEVRCVEADDVHLC